MITDHFFVATLSRIETTHDIIRFHTYICLSLGTSFLCSCFIPMSLCMVEVDDATDIKGSRRARNQKSSPRNSIDQIGITSCNFCAMKGCQTYNDMVLGPVVDSSGSRQPHTQRDAPHNMRLRKDGKTQSRVRSEKRRVDKDKPM